MASPIAGGVTLLHGSHEAGSARCVSRPLPCVVPSIPPQSSARAHVRVARSARALSSRFPAVGRDLFLLATMYLTNPSCFL